MEPIRNETLINLSANWHAATGPSRLIPRPHSGSSSGETRSVMKTSNAFGYYAVSADGRYVWPSQRRSGNTRVYVYQSAFDSCLGVASTDGFVVNMKSMRASSGSGTYTLHLNPPA